MTALSTSAPPPEDPAPGPGSRGAPEGALADPLSWARRHWADAQYRNGYYLMANSAVGAASGFVFWLVVAHLYEGRPGPVGAGAGVVSAMTLVALLGKLGLDAGVIRYVPRLGRRQRARLIATCAGVARGLSLAGAAVTLALLPWAAPELSFVREPRWAVAFALFAAVISVSWVFDAYFTAEREARFSFYRTALFNAVKVVAPFGAIAAAPAFGIPLAWGLAASASLVACLAFVPPLLRRAPAGDGPEVSPRRLLRYSGANYVVNVSEYLPGLALPLLVLAVAGARANAYFYVAWTLAFIAFMASKAIAQSAFAEASHDAGGVALHLRKGLLQHALVVAPLVVGGVALGRSLLGLFPGAYAAQGYPLLVILLASAGFVAVNNLYLTALKALEVTWELVLFPMALLAITFAASPLLLLRLGSPGAAWAWLLANAALALRAGARLARMTRTVPHDGPSPPSLGHHPH